MKVGRAVAAGACGLALAGPMLFALTSEPKPASGALVGVPAQYVAIVQKAGGICSDVPPSILAAQIEQESGWDPRAVSPVGAQGISQFMPATWASHGIDSNGDGLADPFDPVDAIWSQGNYMCDLAGTVTKMKDRGLVDGSIIDLTLAAYNAGLGNVQTHGGVPPFSETIQYVKRITSKAKDYVASGGTSASGNSVVAAAQKYFGVPYVWGGTSASGLDCSGLVYRVFQDLGTTLPVRTADQMAHWSGGAAVDRAQLQPGDLIAFRYGNATSFHHIGIYAGVDGLGTPLMIHAPTFGGVVEQVPLNTAYWQGMSWKIVRF